MEKIAKERRIDNPALSANIEQRRTFAPGAIVLIWQEHILAKRKLKNGKVSLKCSKNWSRACVLSRTGRLYTVRSIDEGNTVRKVHIRAIRELPPNIDPGNT